MKFTSTAAMLAAATIVMSGCGGGEDTVESADADSLMPAAGEECTQDKVGGTITMGEYVMLPSFAPGQGQYGVRGGAQSAAIYDRLMRWDDQAEEFVPKLADALESNEDNTVWTLTLRDDVTFSNGDPLTAEDVAFTVGLHQDPATRSVAMTDVMQIEDVSVSDPRTVQFTLADPWAGFPALLSGTVGEVIPRAKYEATNPQEWARAPIGAGAFVMQEYIPGQKVVLTPNPNYYGGPVCPTLEFVQIPGSQSTLDAFQNGELQAAFLRGPKFVTAAQEAGAKGFHEVISSGAVVNMNSGKGGYDGVFTDPRARQAVGHALDRELMDQRANNGEGQPNSAILAESSRFASGAEGPQYDREQAAELVAELKQEKNWDGKVRLLISDAPELVESGVVVKALLDAAGFDVTIENAPISQVAARQFTGDYELVLGGLAVSDADPASAFFSGMTPGGATNLTGIDDPRLTAAITELKAAADIDAQKAALAELQQVHNEVLPYTVFANGVEYVAVDDTVHGAESTIHSTVLFDNAYLED
ncbi:ABC transporter substrate-binding protein [Dietzia kunjamensis]|uniref:ABC transporter substrate-binding protein n=1 Tax=Dietzia kunjamensis TaxID=322509 RepID=UPI002DBAC090|nr:ABC transporter substrate-binding protein [Dietzia kunjamensis]MEB8325959.1 ABC transporter substrate-binding protein [Dietzia kunjamensis]